MQRAESGLAAEESGAAASLVSRLSLDEKISLLAGADMWRLPPVDRLAIPSLVMTDGPSGARGRSFVAGRSACFPCQTALAAAFDPGLVFEVSAALGRQARRVGAHVLLGPAVNLHRHPLAGRNFECFSEDPELTAQLARSYVQGVQSVGVAACVKHLVCNDSEFERTTISSEVDEQVLRELYLVPFEEAVRAGAWSVMASYNKLNGLHASEHPWLLTQLLRDEWGYDGVVVSDWYATHTTIEALAAGLDLEMPGPAWRRGRSLKTAVRTGKLGMDVIDRSVIRVLRLIERTAGTGDDAAGSVASRVAGSLAGQAGGSLAGQAGGSLAGQAGGSLAGQAGGSLAGRAGGSLAGKAGAAIAGDSQLRSLIQRAGARGMVLLKNDGLLPLRPGGGGLVALIGPNADVGQFQGGGSAQVNPEHVAGIQSALSSALAPAVVRFARGYVDPGWPAPLGPPLLETPDGQPGATIEYASRADPQAPPAGTQTARTLWLLWQGQVLAGRDNGDVLIRARAVIRSDENGVHALTVTGTGRVRVLIDDELVLEKEDSGGRATAFDLRGDQARVDIDLRAGVPASLLAEFEPGPDGHVARLEIGITRSAPADLMSRAVSLAAGADAVVVVAESPPGWETEGRDRPSLALPGDQDRLIGQVAAVNPRTVVVLNTGAPCAMPWIGQVAAVLQMWFPGQEMGCALADVLTGAVNPSGKLPTTFPVQAADVPSAPFYPGANGVVRYDEGLSIGYRRPADGRSPAPLFPFGHGLSYSQFRLGTPVVRRLGAGPQAQYEVLVPVTNINGPAGREVVQLYVTSGGAERPALQLKGFAGVELGPGETGTARIVVPAARLRYWQDGQWLLPGQAVTARIGTSSADLSYAVELPRPRQRPRALQSGRAAARALLRGRRGGRGGRRGGRRPAQPE
ncbi:MAG: glycoside hydrolase family 3 C-terminal domain-containing protein [Streptosporangiaceae bacterium]